MATTFTVETRIGNFEIAQDSTASGKPAPRWRITDSNGDESADVFKTRKDAEAALATHVDEVMAQRGVEAIAEFGDRPAPDAPAPQTVEPTPVVEDAEPRKRSRVEPTGERVGFHFKGDKTKDFFVDEAGRVWLETADGPSLRRQTDRAQLVGWITAGERGYTAR